MKPELLFNSLSAPSSGAGRSSSRQESDGQAGSFEKVIHQVGSAGREGNDLKIEKTAKASEGTPQGEVTENTPSDPSLAALSAFLSMVLSGNQQAPAGPVTGSSAGAPAHATAVDDLARTLIARAIVAPSRDELPKESLPNLDAIRAVNAEAQHLPLLAATQGLTSMTHLPTVAERDESGSWPQSFLSAVQPALASSQAEEFGTTLTGTPLAKAVSSTTGEGQPPVTAELQAGITPLISDATAQGGQWSESQMDVEASETQQAAALAARDTGGKVDARQAGRGQKIDASKAYPVYTNGAVAAKGTDAGMTELAVAGADQTDTDDLIDDNRTAEGGHALHEEAHDQSSVRSGDANHGIEKFVVETNGARGSAREDVQVGPVKGSAALPVEMRSPVDAGGTATIRLEVSPPDIGRVHVRVALSDGAVYANVRTDQSDVRDFLLRNQERLHQALGAYGLDVGSFQVEVGGRGQQGHDFGWRQESWTPSNRTDEPVQLERPASARTALDDRLLNLFA